MSDQLDSDQPSQSQYPSPSPPPEFPPPKRCRSDSDLDNDPAFFVLFSGHAIIHRILTNPVPTVLWPSGVRELPEIHVVSGPGKVGMSQENFTTNMRRQREPGVFHRLQQHLADKFENELDCYAWNLGGLSAGKLYKHWGRQHHGGAKKGRPLLLGTTVSPYLERIGISVAPCITLCFMPDHLPYFIESTTSITHF